MTEENEPSVQGNLDSVEASLAKLAQTEDEAIALAHEELGIQVDVLNGRVEALSAQVAQMSKLLSLLGEQATLNRRDIARLSGERVVSQRVPTQPQQQSDTLRFGQPAPSRSVMAGLSAPGQDEGYGDPLIIAQNKKRQLLKGMVG